jgi:hypothetical protein
MIAIIYTSHVKFYTAQKYFSCRYVRSTVEAIIRYDQIELIKKKYFAI